MTDPRTNNTQPEVEDTAEAAEDYLDDNGAFDLDRFQAETRREPYPFRWAGKKWELPNIYDLPTGILDLVGQDDLGVDDVRRGMEMAFGPEQWGQINTLRPIPIMAVMELFNRWIAWCGVDRGEAESSVASSNGTAGPSKRTSTAGTASASPRRSTGARKTATRRVRSST